MTGYSRHLRVGFTAVMALICMTMLSARAGEDAVIRGVVTDQTGKPIRGALVKATAGGKTTSRYSQRDGRYEITVSAGTYQVAVNAFGFGPRTQTKETAQAGETNFSLSPHIDVMRLQSADIETLLPDNQETKLIRQECDSCHNLSTVLKWRGKTAAQWRAFLPVMTGRVRELESESPMWSPSVYEALSAALAKYFGPGARYFGPDADAPTLEEIKHTDISDAALKATYREWDIPGGNVSAHSIAINPEGTIAWFSGGGKINRFNVQAETFQQYDIPAPGSGPHTPVVAQDGRVWMGLSGKSPVKLVSVDPQSGAVNAFSLPNQKPIYGGHTPSVDADGKIWLSNFAPGEVWSFDPKAQEFNVQKFPIPASYPAGSTGDLELSFGPPAKYDRYTALPTAPVNAWPYHIVRDSKGVAWFSSLFLGTVTSFNPSTGETKHYKPEGAPSTRGIVIDADDNVWFNNFHGHRLGKLDPKTGVIKQYEMPTKRATGYAVMFHKGTGHLWLADMNGNNITRFDPKTEQFVEYPMPTHMAIPRFISVADDGKVWFTEQWGGKIGVLDPGDGARNASASRAAAR